MGCNESYKKGHKRLFGDRAHAQFARPSYETESSNGPIIHSRKEQGDISDTSVNKFKCL